MGSRGAVVSVGQNPQYLAVLDDVVIYLIQGVVLELEPVTYQRIRSSNNSLRIIKEQEEAGS